MKVSELTGTALDWAVAKCEGWAEFDEDLQAFTQHEIDGYGWLSLDYFHPSENWSIAGPIIERECIKVGVIDDSAPVIWAAQLSDPFLKLKSVHSRTGPTALISAMRCFVASKLGDEIEIPKELQHEHPTL